VDLSVRELDGLPLIIAPDDGPAEVGLLVRVGWADEPLSRAGLSHLVEHLALSGIDRPEHPWNGAVDATHTLFHAEGTPEQCAGFLQEVAAGLSALPLDRLEVEGRVLRSEAAHHRRSSVSGRLLELRCGPAGYGACEQEQFGLRALDAEEMLHWAAHRFTRRSAVVFWTGPPPPDDLSCPLPDGPAAPPPRHCGPVPGCRCRCTRTTTVPSPSASLCSEAGPRGPPRGYWSAGCSGRCGTSAGWRTTWSPSTERHRRR
jgi:zinc protease